MCDRFSAYDEGIDDGFSDVTSSSEERRRREAEHVEGLLGQVALDRYVEG